jgi:hypothetical protein
VNITFSPYFLPLFNHQTNLKRISTLPDTTNSALYFQCSYHQQCSLFDVQQVSKSPLYTMVTRKTFSSAKSCMHSKSVICLYLFRFKPLDGPEMQIMLLK